MKKMLLEDVNLADIHFYNDGKGIRIDFIDMYEGKPIAFMDCNKVLHFFYSNSFDDTDHGFACYVGEVTLQSFTSREDIVNVLNSMRYGFKKSDIYGNELGELESLLENELHQVSIDGGEISIRILCKMFPSLFKVNQ
jgi:hypothetical protein